MKRLLIKIIFLFLPFILSAKTAVIYIDAVHRISNDSFQLDYANGVISITDSILAINDYDKVVVFISNGNDPIIITKKSNFNNRIIYDRLQGGININDEICRLNMVMVEQNVLGDLYNKDSVDFHFIMEIKSVSVYNYFQYFFDKLLLINRLVKEGQLQPNVLFKVYFPNKDKLDMYYSDKSTILLKKINELKSNYYEIIYY
jgi:hypothetical protein